MRVHSLTLFCTFGSMRCDFWSSFLPCTIASLFLGCKPKAKVATHIQVGSLGSLFSTKFDSNGIQRFLIKPFLSFYISTSTIVWCHLQMTNHFSKPYKDLTTTFAFLFAFFEIELTFIRSLPNMCNIHFCETIST